MVYDPVCGMEIKPIIEDKDELLSLEYKGEKYFFCSPICTATFLSEPEMFIARFEDKMEPAQDYLTNTEYN